MSENKQDNDTTSPQKGSEQIEDLEPMRLLVVDWTLSLMMIKTSFFRPKWAFINLMGKLEKHFSITIIFLIGVLIYGTYTNSVFWKNKDPSMLSWPKYKSVFPILL